MSETITTTPDGVQLPLASLPVALTFAGGFVQTLTVEYQGSTYVQTFTYDGGYVSTISGWVKQ